MFIHSQTHLLWATLILLALCSCSTPPQHVIEPAPCCTQGAVVTAHPLATEVGLQVLRDGGNSFDAAIAVQFALAVVYPRAGNIGGGGFMVYREANGHSGALDFREVAPASAHAHMYLDRSGRVIQGKSSIGVWSIGVPGVVDGMVQMHERLGSGRMAWSDLLRPAIDLASNGFTLTEAEAAKLNDYQDMFLLHNSLEMPFIHPYLEWAVGDTLVLKDLAKTLTRIKDRGRAGFYSGKTATMVLGSLEKGYMVQEDLDAYRAIWREALIGHYKNCQVISMPPPSSGGIALLQLLKGSETYDWSQSGHNTAESIHYMAELARRVYADRATHLGDPDYWDVPVDMLLDSTYLAQRNALIDMTQATKSVDIKEGEVDIIESVETTHFSIIDPEGNAVALTTTLNGNYGSKVLVDGAGFFLNNEMDDFSIKPGEPNMYGLVGAAANAIAPGKRMLSSMTPTILTRNDSVYMILGTPGGSTIITSVYQTILNVVEHNMTLEEAIAAKRTHHQWLPDRIICEEGTIDSTNWSRLDELGHQIEIRSSIGRVDAIMQESECLQSVGDARGDDWGSCY